MNKHKLLNIRRVFAPKLKIRLSCQVGYSGKEV